MLTTSIIDEIAEIDILIKQNKFNDSEMKLKKILYFDNKNKVAWHKYGYVAYLKKEYIEGVQRFENSLKLNPDNVWSLIGLINCHSELKNKDNLKRLFLENKNKHKNHIEFQSKFINFFYYIKDYSTVTEHINSLDKKLLDNDVRFVEILNKIKTNNQIKINNKVFLKKKNGEIIESPTIDGLKIDFLGSDNIIEIEEDSVFLNCHFKMGKGCKILIDKTHSRGLRHTIVSMTGSIEAFLHIKEGTSIESAQFLMGNEKKPSVIVGKNCLFSSNVIFRTSDGHAIFDINSKKILNRPKPIIIGDHVWGGANITILKGAMISTNSIIGIASLVTKIFDQENIIIGGNPAKILKENINWDRKHVRDCGDFFNENVNEDGKDIKKNFNKYPEKKDFFFTLDKDVSLQIDDVFCKYHIYNTNTPLMITFSNLHYVSSKEDILTEKSPWGFDFISNQKINVISFQCIQKNNWFRSDKFHNFLEKITKKFDIFPKKIGFGYSMGGFAIATFSDILKLDDSILLSPISSLNSDICPFENRFNSYLNLDWETGAYYDSANKNVKGYIFYDPIHTIDTSHAKRYKNLINIRIPGSGHQTANFLQNLDLLKYVVKSIYNNEFNMKFFIRKLRERRFKSEYYKWMLSDENKHLTIKRKEILKKYQEIYIR